MHMNAYEFALSENITGTNAEIVAALKATGVTESPISLAYLMEMLNLRGMLRKTDGSGGQERWVGTLQNLKAALVAMGLTDQVTAYEMWFSHVTNPRQTSWDTTLREYAAGFWSMKQNFAGVENMPSVADFAAIAALGGGWKFADLTVEQFAAQRTAAESEAAAFAARSERRALYDAFENAVGTSEQAEKIAELRTMLDALEAG
jgi:hypothetical protein